MTAQPWNRETGCGRNMSHCSRKGLSAGLDPKSAEIRLFEVDDTYAYKELQHLIALGLYSEGAEAGRSLEAGETKPDGKMPVNVSGGALAWASH